MSDEGGQRPDTRPPIASPSSGDAYEGALGRAIEPPPADLEDPPGRRAVVYGGALIGGLLVAIAGATLLEIPVGIAGGLVFGLIVTAQGRRGPGERPPREPVP